MSAETVVLLNIVFRTCDIFSLMNTKLKEQYLFNILIFCNNISLYYDIYSFKTSLLNKSINLYIKKKKKLTDPQTFD